MACNMDGPGWPSPKPHAGTGAAQGRHLQLYLKLGLRLKRTNRAIKFSQSSWLKKWIDLHTNFRKAAKNDLEKDHFKLLNFAVFGKCMENVRDRIEIKTAFDAKYLQKYVSNLIFRAAKF